MKLSVRITHDTTDSELIYLGNLFTALGMNRGTKVTSFTPPADPDEAEAIHIPATPEQEAAIDAATGITPKRRRRTKDEIAAAEAAAKAEEQGAVAPGEAGNDPASTQPAPPPATPPSETASTAPASESPSDAGKTYTHAEVQALAVDTARRYGPEKVKALIATYPNAAKIAELDEGDLAGFVAKLQAITA